MDLADRVFSNREKKLRKIRFFAIYSDFVFSYTVELIRLCYYVTIL